VSQPDQHLAITCGVCHDPHAADNAGQLRFAVDVPNEEQNLCMKCHHKRGTPDLASQNRGPHSPEGPVLLGYGGWWPPNLQFLEQGDTALIVATHGSTRNPKLCAGCHVNAFAATDPASGTEVFSTGHLFLATPCLVDGVPVPGDCPTDQRTFETCTECHGSEAVARSLQQVALLRLTNLADELGLLIDQIPAAEFDANDGRYSTGEGAKFNHQLALFPGSEVHNPFLVEALLIASINQVEEDYGLVVPPSLSLKRELGRR
jgi:predicted CXXCH cytochrome family protein